MDTFVVGEVAIVTADLTTGQKAGDEVMIWGVLDYFCPNGVDPHAYVVRGEIAVCSCALRKRRPPQDWHQLCKLDEVPADCVREREVRV